MASVQNEWEAYFFPDDRAERFHEPDREGVSSSNTSEFGSRPPSAQAVERPSVSSKNSTESGHHYQTPQFNTHGNPVSPMERSYPKMEDINIAEALAREPVKRGLQSWLRNSQKPLPQKKPLSKDAMQKEKDALRAFQTELTSRVLKHQ